MRVPPVHMRREQWQRRREPRCGRQPSPCSRPKTLPSHHDEGCVFLVRLTLSRFSTCSSVCELSMICADARRPGGCWEGSDVGAGVATTCARGTRRARLGVGPLGLLDGLVVLIARRDLARQPVVDARQSLGQDPQVVLDFSCSDTGALASTQACATAPTTHAGRCELPRYPTFLLLITRDRLVQLLTLAPQLLDALPAGGARAHACDVSRRLGV